MRAAIAAGILGLVGHGLLGCGDVNEAVGSAGPETASSGGSGTSSGDDGGTAGTIGGMLQTGTDGPPPTGAADTTMGVADSTDGGSEDTAAAGAGPHDGFYSGTIQSTITLPALGAVLPCTGSVTLTVAEVGNPAVVGMGACQAIIPQLGNAALDVTATMTGALSPPTASGALMFSVAIGGVTDETTWTGNFAGDAFDGTFAGDTTVMGYTATYTGSWASLR